MANYDKVKLLLEKLESEGLDLSKVPVITYKKGGFSIDRFFIKPDYLLKFLKASSLEEAETKLNQL